MRIAKLSLICLVAFVFMVGCGMLGKKAEMTRDRHFHGGSCNGIRSEGGHGRIHGGSRC